MRGPHHQWRWLWPFLPFLLAPCVALWVARDLPVNSNPAACRSGTAVLDSDGDGQFEVFFAGCQGHPSQHLWFDVRNRTFVDIAAPFQIVRDEGAPSVGVCGCDVDNDGGAIEVTS